MHNNRDCSASNGVGSNTNGIEDNLATNNDVANLKNQVQQPSTPGSASNHNDNTTPATASKPVSSSLQDTNNQPQMAAVAAGEFHYQMSKSHFTCIPSHIVPSASFVAKIIP